MRQLLGMVAVMASIGSLRAGEIIDCHVHLWELARPAGLSWIKKDDAVLQRNFLAEDFAKVAAANQVTGVVVVQAGQSLPDNAWLLQITAGRKDLYRGVVGNLSEVIATDKFAPLFDELCKDTRFVGYRLSGRYQQGLSEALYRDLERTATAGRSVDFLCGGYTMAEVAEIARRLPKLRIIINHFGSVRLTGGALDTQWEKDFRAVAALPNVHCKVSALYGRFEKQPAPKELSAYRAVLDLAWECFGEDRLVYGSDWPVSEATGDYASVVALMRSYFDAKGTAASGKVFAENARRFYALPVTK